MYNEENQIKECFEYFGQAMYSVQLVEKGILNLLLFSYVPNITKERCDELLAEKSLLTFGQLKKEVVEMGLCTDEFRASLDNFHSKRDWLAHSYWWDRAIEFENSDLRYKIVKELEELSNEFGHINDLITERLKTIMSNNDINFEQIVSKFREFIETPQTSTSRKLTKNETLLGIFKYESAPGSQIPIFKLKDNTYWSLCEVGLTTFSQIKNDEELTSLERTLGIFPINQFNPRPKVTDKGDYELDLKKNGLVMKVERVIIDDKAVYKWAIKKK
jgi:hypothetical protein